MGSHRFLVSIQIVFVFYPLDNRVTYELRYSRIFIKLVSSSDSLNDNAMITPPL